MNMLVLLPAATLVGAALVVATMAQEPPKKIEPATPEYSEAFCAGWNAAVAVERGRFVGWARQMIAGRGADDPMRAVVDAVANYVVIQSIPGKLVLDIGKEVDCTPKPAPEPKKEEPAK